ncbi:MAG: SRPBCC family protein [Gammaproteobacteria bacterium]|nr:SRPBCC family protein [Gammaproteobacteria bacterium]MCY4228494.1 SRPBCC family protein [Gammaproteobacteria bacterium]
MNLTLLIVVILIGLVAIAALMMPATTRTTVEIRFDAPIDAVWEVYTDFESQSNWRSDVASVEISEDRQSWTETLEKSKMTIRFQLVEQSPPNRLVLKSASDGRFEGRYVAEFRQEGDETIGTFTEEATTFGVIPKVMRFLFFNSRKFIEEYAAESKVEINRRAS